MKEALLRKWAHAPWHCWLKEQPRWLELFAELWSRLPEQALRGVLHERPSLVILPPVQCGRAVRIGQPLNHGAHILQLDACLLDRPREEALAILAHELAHLCTAISEDELENDLRADRLVMQWGFQAGLVRALRSDLDEKHPRVVAALAA